MIIQFDLPLVNGFFEDIGIPLKSDGLDIHDRTFNLFEARLTKTQKEFIPLLGKRISNYDHKILPIEYRFDKDHLNTIIAICYNYEYVLNHIWGDNYIGYIKEDLKEAQLQYQELKKFLFKTREFNRYGNNTLDIYLGNERFKTENNTIIDIVTTVLFQLEEKIKHFPNVSRKAECVFTIDDALHKEFGKHKQLEISETQMLTWKLFQFLKSKKIVVPAEGRKESNAMYYKCIADLYTLMGIPTMKFGKDISKKSSSLSWSYLAEDYDKPAQVRRIEGWIYHYLEK